MRTGFFALVRKLVVNHRFLSHRICSEFDRSRAMECIEEDCNEPRYKTYPRCEDCYKRNERDRKRRQKENKVASPSLEELYDAPQQEARERHARRAGEEAAFQMEANLYGYQKTPDKPTVMERLTNRLMN